MFVFSLKATNLKRIILFTVAAILIMLGAYFMLSTSDESESALKNAPFSKAETADERIAYINSFGYEVTPDPLKVEEVIIPEEFDETYESYNEIQKSQNFDLEKFKGCRVKKWTYEVTNYTDGENSGVIEINLLIYNSNIIGADIQSLEQDGFLKALTSQQS